MQFSELPAEFQRQAAASVCPRTKATLEQVLASMQGCEAEPIAVDGKPVGAVVSIGPDVHACINGGYGLWLSRGLIRRTLKRLIEAHGFARTSVQEGNEVGRSFVERLGFVETTRQGGAIFFEVKSWDGNQ
jgi:hypothetical protein